MSSKNKQPGNQNPTAASIDRLIAKGFTERFAAEKAGLRAIGNGRVYAPEDLVVEHIARVEQESDADRQAIIFGLRGAKDGVAGTYTVPFGPAMSLLDAQIVSELDTTQAP